MAVFLVNGIHGESYALPSPDDNHPFNDIGGHWADAWVEQLYDEGNSAVYPNGPFRHLNPVSRTEIAVFLQQVSGAGSLSPFVDLEVEQPSLTLTGQSPVKVMTENGPILTGDLPVSSSTPGHAIRCVTRRVRRIFRMRLTYSPCGNLLISAL